MDDSSWPQRASTPCCLRVVIGDHSSVMAVSLSHGIRVPTGGPLLLLFLLAVVQ